MIFELTTKNNDEVIDKIDFDYAGIQEAKTYFMGRKRLDEKNFDEIFEVKKIQKYHKPISYDWWKEESKNLDLEKE